MRGDSVCESVLNLLQLTGSSILTLQLPNKHPLKLSSSAALEQLAAFFIPHGSIITSQLLQGIIQQDLQDDDVLCASFMRSVMLVTQETSLDPEALQVLSSFGCKRLFLANTDLGKGPYFYSSNGIYRVFRLYPDTHDAFVTSTIPSPSDKNT